jgi:hypothetical protein
VPAVAAVPEAPAAISGTPAAFKTSARVCQRDSTLKLRTGDAEDKLHVPEKALRQYTQADMDGAGSIPQACTPLAQGNTYCTKRDTKTVTMGGKLLFSTGGGCVAPPTAADGSPCCHMKMWQPNTGGFYLNNCSMKCASHLSWLGCISSCTSGWELCWVRYTREPSHDKFAVQGHPRALV